MGIDLLLQYLCLLVLDFVSNTDSLLSFPLSEESSSSLKTGYDVQGMMSGHQAAPIRRDEGPLCSHTPRPWVLHSKSSADA